MRQVNIKLNYNSLVSVSTREIGFIGEHNATELIIEVPQQCISDADCFLLNFNDGRLDIVSHIITTETRIDGAWIEDGKIHCVLWQQLTRGQRLSITVEGYKYSGAELECLFKLPRIENLRLRPVNEGSIKPCKDLHGLQAQIQRILAALYSSSESNYAGIRCVTILPETPKADAIVYLNGAGIYHFTGTEWEALTDNGEGLSELEQRIDAIRQDLPTSESIESWDNAASKSHSHDNQDVIDAITDDSISEWNDAASMRHEHPNSQDLEEVTAENLILWTEAAEQRHTHHNEQELSLISMEDIAHWDSAYQSAHSHDNMNALRNITYININAWNEAYTKRHNHSNADVLSSLSYEFITRWNAAADEKHSHENKPSLDKLIVSESYAALPSNAGNGSVGIVTGIDTTSKSIALYDPATDAETPVTIAPRLVYNASAQVDDSLIVAHAGDDITVTFIPVYTSAESNPAAGGAGLFFVTDQSNPKAYAILVGLDESIRKEELVADYDIADAGAEVLFFYAFESVTGDLNAVSEENEGEYETLAEHVTMSAGWNVGFLTENGVTIATLTDPNVYCDLGALDRIKMAAPGHDELYDVLRLVTSQDKRGIYHKTDGEWVRYYGAELDDLADRLSIVERGKPDDVTLLGLEPYSALVVRDEAIAGESIMDVPVFVQGELGIICSLYEYTSDPVGQGYDNGVELVDIRQFDTGMPLFVLAVTVNGVRYVYFPQDYNGGLAGMVYAGWNVNNQPSDPPTITNFTPDRFSFGDVTYDDLDDLPDAAKSALRSLSQCVNVSAAAMGTIRVPDDAVTRFAGTFEPNHKYAFDTSSDCTFTLPSVPFAETDAQFVLYLTCTADVDVTFPQGTLFANGTAPNTETGNHKIIGCWLRDEGAWAIGGVDYEVVS